MTTLYDGNNCRVASLDCRQLGLGSGERQRLRRGTGWLERTFAMQIQGEIEIMGHRSLVAALISWNSRGPMRFAVIVVLPNSNSALKPSRPSP
ncbi:hypothetical protein CRG98_014573 [Punica granatum]|uniref:Uncharacterized protein n=1 Tax=Punica granatum TaxID=22663 RepID=A0A2I0K997_PUNGR|nr:hypothetical protein CRG98_014573 [Punica granatum]